MSLFDVILLPLYVSPCVCVCLCVRVSECVCMYEINLVYLAFLPYIDRQKQSHEPKGCSFMVAQDTKVMV